jgi:hypothetical protein
MKLVTQRNAGRESAFGFVRLPMPGSLATLCLIEASPGNPS